MTSWASTAIGTHNPSSANSENGSLTQSVSLSSSTRSSEVGLTRLSTPVEAMPVRPVEVEVTCGLGMCPRAGEGTFGKAVAWRDARGIVAIDHHLRGNRLESAEPMNALSVVVTRADELDDELMKEFGSADLWVTSRPRQ
jgi:hypothetical protein